MSDFTQNQVTENQNLAANVAKTVKTFKLKTDFKEVPIDFIYSAFIAQNLTSITNFGLDNIRNIEAGTNGYVVFITTVDGLLFPLLKIGKAKLYDYMKNMDKQSGELRTTTLANFDFSCVLTYIKDTKSLDSESLGTVFQVKEELNFGVEIFLRKLKESGELKSEYTAYSGNSVVAVKNADITSIIIADFTKPEINIPSKR